MDYLIAILSSTALATVVCKVIDAIGNRKKKNDSVKNALMVILWDRLNYLCNEYISAGEISSDDLHRLCEMHRIYHDPDELNGNGYLDALMESVKKLHIK